MILILYEDHADIEKKENLWMEEQFPSINVN